tara:strand:- start:606 stop:932 length:327 start_codon:yes stop_codon:yes gene_type:complete
MATTITWDNANFTWDNNSHTWDEVVLVEKAIKTGTDGSYPEDPVKALDTNLTDDEKQRFVKLICKVKGIETYSGQKTINNDINITAKDIQLVAQKVLGIDIMAENINV